MTTALPESDTSEFKGEDKLIVVYGIDSKGKRLESSIVKRADTEIWFTFLRGKDMGEPDAKGRRLSGTKLDGLDDGLKWLKSKGAVKFTYRYDDYVQAPEPKRDAGKDAAKLKGYEDDLKALQPELARHAEERNSGSKKYSPGAYRKAMMREKLLTRLIDQLKKKTESAVTEAKNPLPYKDADVELRDARPDEIPKEFIHTTHTAEMATSIARSGFDLGKFGLTARKYRQQAMTLNDPKGIYALLYDPLIEKNERRPFVVFAANITKALYLKDIRGDAKAKLAELFGKKGEPLRKALRALGYQAVIRDGSEQIILDPTLIRVTRTSPGKTTESLDVSHNELSGLSGKTGKHQFIFKDGGVEIGEIDIQPRADGNFEVSNVLVWPKFQRKGYATKFYAHVQAFVKKLGKKLFISNDRTADAKALHAAFEKGGKLKNTELTTEAVKLPVLYHGSLGKIEKFDVSKLGSGRGHDQDGPGFYFTDDVTDARRYASPNGFVHTATVTLRKAVPDKGKAKSAEVLQLINAAPDLADTLTNWDENPAAAKRNALAAMLNQENPQQTFQSVWYDFYKGHEADYVRNMVKLGYDGLLVDRARNGGTLHVVVFNPDVVKFTDTKPLAEI